MSEIINVPYPTLKSEYIKKSLKLFYIPLSDGYSVLAGATTYILKSQVFNDDNDGDTDDQNFQDFISNLKDSSLEISCDAEAEGLCSPIECDGKPLVATTVAEGLKANKISPNWCDPTTWWYSSVYVVNEVAVRKDGYDGYVYTLTHKNIIDTFHGKLTGEWNQTDVDGNSLRVTVKIDDIEKIEKDPHTNIGDYIVNYVTGEIVFDLQVEQSSIVKATYHYENGSTWVIKPEMGEVCRIKSVECQFSDDIIMTDSMIYEIWAYNPYDPPNKVLATSPDVYKTMWDFINDANKAYPAIPKIGGSYWRGLTTQVYVFSWDFQSTSDLSDKYGVELRVRLEHNIPYGGTCCTGTFYCLRSPE